MRFNDRVIPGERDSLDCISDITNENLLRRMRPHLSTIRYGLDRLIREHSVDGDVKERAREAMKFMLIEDEGVA
jgi:hypothetical protein